MNTSHYRDRFFFAETPRGYAYFPYGRFSVGVIIPTFREEEFLAFQHRWSVRTRVASALTTVLLIAAPGLLKLTGVLVIGCMLLSRMLAVRRLLDGLPQSDVPATRFGFPERMRRDPPGPIVALLVLCIALIAICAPRVYDDLAGGLPVTVQNDHPGAISKSRELQKWVFKAQP